MWVSCGKTAQEVKEKVLFNMNAAAFSSFLPLRLPFRPGVFDSIPRACASKPDGPANTPELFRTCRVCREKFHETSNGPMACRFHAADWMGAENSVS
jgi:hypothetical protein